MTTLRITAVIITVILLTLTTAEARRGACDGVNACVCGSTQARYFGLPRIFNGHNLWQAREWAHAFPRTSPHPGAVGVKPHHVYRIVSLTGPGTAIVADEKGTYERRIHNDIFVDPNGNTASSVFTSVRTYAAKSHRRYTPYRHRHYARAEYIPPDRMDSH